MYSRKAAYWSRIILEKNISVKIKSQKNEHICSFRASDFCANILEITEIINSGGNYAKSNYLVANGKKKCLRLKWI